MKPINFKQSTKTLMSPGCGDLPVYSDGKTVISCWKPSFVERVKILLTGRVYVGVKSGNTQPPMYVDASTPFKAASVADWFRWLWATIKEKFNDLITGLKRQDVRKHVLAGFLIATIVSFLVGSILPNPKIAVWFGLGAAVLIGAAKELIYDLWMKKGTPDWIDFIGTTIGGIVGTILAFVIIVLTMLG